MAQRVLVYGVGVIGSVYAVRLAKAGMEVTVLARGERLTAIEEGGLRIHHVFLKEEERAAVRVVEAIDPSASWELVLVAVRADQTPAALADVARCRDAKAVVVIGNNLVGHEAQADLVGRDRFVLGFGAFGGYRDGAHITYLDGRTPERPRRRSHTTVGVLCDEAEPALSLVRRSLALAEMPTTRSADMVAWLQCHGALVLPLAAAIYACGGDQRRFSRTRDALVLGLRAVRELLGALNAVGVSTEPRLLQAVRWAPEPWLLRRLAKGLEEEAARVAVFGHANAPGGHAEMAGAARTLTALVQRAGRPLPNWERLLPAFSAPQALLEDGSRSLPARWW